MANMLTWLFQLLFLPCTLAIANVRKFLHMQRLITKEHIAVHTNLILMFKARFISLSN